MTLCKKGKKRQKRNHWKGGERSTLDAEKESLGGAGSLSWHQVGKEERTREATTSGDQDAPKNRLQSVAVGQLHRTKQHVWEGDLSKADMIEPAVDGRKDSWSQDEMRSISDEDNQLQKGLLEMWHSNNGLERSLEQIQWCLLALERAAGEVVSPEKLSLSYSEDACVQTSWAYREGLSVKWRHSIACDRRDQDRGRQRRRDLELDVDKSVEMCKEIDSSRVVVPKNITVSKRDFWMGGARIREASALNANPNPLGTSRWIKFSKSEMSPRHLLLSYSIKLKFPGEQPTCQFIPGLVSGCNQ